ncbi:MAG: efflux transporter outer membrane subunit [Verrucomicrobiaceae bacterium]|nr:efflux transporter outer membrane subunit [Verrucomicrobiaceae bacterium]
MTPRGEENKKVRWAALSSLVLAIVCLPGCVVVGPDFERPGVAEQLPESFDLPPGWKVADPGGRPDLPREWWKIYRDEGLDRLMSEAEENNQDLVAAFHRVEQAAAISGRARSAWFPLLTFEPSARRTRRSATISNTSENLTGRTTTNLSLPLVIDYELDLWGKLRRAIEAAEAETLASDSAYRQVLLTLQTELAARYTELRATDTEIGIFEEAVGLRRKSLELNQKRFDAGDTDAVDVSRAQTELSSTRTELLELRQTREELVNAIAVLTGRPSSGFHIPHHPLRGAPPAFPAAVPCELLERRPDIAEAEHVMIAENARIGIAKAAFFPTVKLSATAGLESGSIDQLFNIASRTWGLGPEISFPVFDAGANKAELARSEARYDETVALYRSAILKAVREVDDAFVAISNLGERASTQQQTVSSAQETVRLSRQRYEAGVVAYFEVVDAQRTELDAEQGAVRILAARHLAAIALVKALGGGW